MQWLLIIVGAIVALIILVVVIGLLLPKAHRVSRTIRLQQNPQMVFETIRDWKSYPAWRQGVSVQEWTGPNGATGWVEKMNRMEIPLQILESSSNKLVTKIADPKLPFGGTWTYEVQPDGTGSAVTITEDGEVYNPIFRFVSKFIMGHKSTLNGYLRALGKKFGQDVMLQ